MHFSETHPLFWVTNLIISNGVFSVFSRVQLLVIQNMYVLTGDSAKTYIYSSSMNLLVLTIHYNSIQKIRIGYVLKSDEFRTLVSSRYSKNSSHTHLYIPMHTHVYTPFMPVHAHACPCTPVHTHAHSCTPVHTRIPHTPILPAHTHHLKVK